MMKKEYSKFMVTDDWKISFETVVPGSHDN